MVRRNHSFYIQYYVLSFSPKWPQHDLKTWNIWRPPLCSSLLILPSLCLCLSASKNHTSCFLRDRNLLFVHKISPIQFSGGEVQLPGTFPFAVTLWVTWTKSWKWLQSVSTHPQGHPVFPIRPFLVASATSNKDNQTQMMSKRVILTNESLGPKKSKNKYGLDFKLW